MNFSELEHKAAAILSAQDRMRDLADHIWLIKTKITALERPKAASVDTARLDAARKNFALAVLAATAGERRLVEAKEQLAKVQQLHAEVLAVIASIEGPLNAIELEMRTRIGH